MPRRKPTAEESEAAQDFAAVLIPDEHATPTDTVTPAPEMKRTAQPKPVSKATAIKAGQQTLVTVHGIAAKVLDEPQLALTGEEAKALSAAALDLLEAYGVSLATHPKMAAWVTFLSCAAEIEVPRVVVLLHRAPRERRAEREQGPPPAIVLPTQEQAS